MGHEDLDKKYLDPAVNPMLPGSTLPAFEKKPEGPDKYLDPKRNPMIDAPAETGSVVEAALLAGKIAAAFPTETEIELAGHKLTKMADGSWTIEGKPLAELPAATLEAINAALAKKS